MAARDAIASIPSFMIRLRPTLALLAGLALLAQALLPTLHARNWARSSGDGLLFAFCGKVSPQLLAKARAANPDLSSRLERTSAPGGDPLDCPLCLVVHGISTGLVGVALLLMLGRHAANAATPLHCRPPAAAPLRRYQPRAPPALSCAH